MTEDNKLKFKESYPPTRSLNQNNDSENNEINNVNDQIYQDENENEYINSQIK